MPVEQMVDHAARVKEVDDYRKENGVSLRQALKELDKPAHWYSDSKYALKKKKLAPTYERTTALPLSPKPERAAKTGFVLIAVPYDKLQAVLGALS